jgi:hypothetical protein
MSSPQRLLGAACAAGLLMGLGACVSTPRGAQSARVSNNFEVYAPFDNQRDWGPSYLVGPPSRHLGDQTRIDDTRAVPHAVETAPADPDAPPLNTQPPPAQTPP